MRITVTAGHNIYVNGIFDPGAVKNPYVEADIVRETVAKLISLLKAQGHEVLDATPYNQKFTGKTNTLARKSHHELRCKKADEFKSDLYLDVHLNSGGGKGVECWVHNKNSKAYPYAEKICRSISKEMNLNNRGVKVNPNYWSLSLCETPAIIVEGAFVDTASDMEKLDPERYAIAIAKVFGEVKETIPIADKNKSNTLYKVQVGAFSIRENADKLLEELQNKGFNGFLAIEGREEMHKPKETKSKYYKKGGAHIIETTPENIEIDVLGDTLHGANRFGVNGTFFDTKTAPVDNPNSCVFIAMNNGKPVSSNAQFNGYNAPSRGTMIYHTNGKMGFRKLQNINSIRGITRWAIGGYMVKPYMDFNNEKIPGTINYKTAHTYIGYDTKGKIYLIVKPNHMIYEIVPLLNELKIANAIVLDGGGSSQLNHPNGNFRSSRKINTAILLKEV